VENNNKTPDRGEPESPGYAGSGHPEITNPEPSYAVESPGIASADGDSADSGAEDKIPPAASHTIPEVAEALARDRAAPHILRHDIETRSEADLKAVGAAKYAADPSTEILCMTYAVDDEPVQLWLPGDPVPSEFIEAVANPSWIVEAHNASFEIAHAKSILEPRHGFPAIPIERRRCSMAKAYAAALPGKLEKAIEALSLPYPKDKAGQVLMRRMTKPQPDGSWIEDAASLERLCDYCRRDVEAERALSKALPPLTADEQALWELDARINERGFAVDAALLEAALHLVTETEAELQEEFRGITGLDSTNQTAKFITWLGTHDCVVDDVQKGTLGRALRRKGLAPDVRRAIELRLQLAHAAANKVAALLAWRGAGDRVRGTLKFHGASTGRWVGTGPQPQNFKRDSEGIDAKVAAVMNGGAGLASPVEAVGDIARAMIVAAPGHRLMIGDFSGIESRVIAWISGQQSKLDMWTKFDRTGALTDDPYFIMGRACALAEDIARAKGKICDLAFGFQGGQGAWKNMAPDDDASTDDDIRRYQRSWRKQHPHTVAFWSGIDNRAIAAVRTPGMIIEYKRLCIVREGEFLRITLPSGRALSYPFPRVERGGKYGDARVVFKDASMGKWGDNNFGKGAYGGIWTENIVSAVARDLLAGAMRRLESAGYPIVLTVHDEIVCEVPNGFGSLEEFRSLITAAPEWVTSPLPIAAKVRESQRFSKPDNGGAVAGDPSRPEPEPEPEPELGDAEPDIPADSDELAALLDDAGDGESHDSVMAHQAAGGAAASAGAPERNLGAVVDGLLASIHGLCAEPAPHDDVGEAPRGNGGNGSAESRHGNGHDTGGYPHGEQRTGSHSVATYLYLDHLGRNHTKIKKLAATAARRAQYPQSFWVDDHWVTKKPAGWLKIPYRLPELLAGITAGRVVLIPEGEKDVETLVELGFVATTNSEGATPVDAKKSKWTPELNKWFHGATRAYILEDNDDPGRKFAREKVDALRGIISDIRIVSFPDVPQGEDVSYWIKELGHSKEELLARCKAAGPPQDEAELESVRASDVTMRAHEWLWPNRFAKGKIGVVAGLPDEGKGQALCYIAARVTRGLPWPITEGHCPLGNVVILSAEEDPADSLVPRLAAAGADLDRVHIVKMVRSRDENGQECKRMFSLVDDLEKLRRKIVEVGDVMTVLIDPITAYLGIDEIDSYRDTDVRAVLGPLKELAEEKRIAVITVMHFNKKVDITNAMLRISNSLAFVGLPRHVYAVVADEENERKLFVRAKNNDAALSDNQTLAFHFEVKEVGFDPALDKPIVAPFIGWDAEYVDVTTNEAMQAASENKSPGERDAAKNLLLALLADGREVLMTEIMDVAKGHGFSSRTVRRAKEELRIIVEKEHGKEHGQWVWKLPPQEQGD
jgi:DNA polymerase